MDFGALHLENIVLTFCYKDCGALHLLVVRLDKSYIIPIDYQCFTFLILH